MKIVPLSGVSSPAMSLKVVVLPQPLSPTMTRNSPLLTVRLARSTATTEPNRFVSSRRARETTNRMLVKATPKDNMPWLVMDKKVGYDDFCYESDPFKRRYLCRRYLLQRI